MFSSKIIRKEIVTLTSETPSIDIKLKESFARSNQIFEKKQEEMNQLIEKQHEE